MVMLILEMTLHPEILKKAQSEITRVVGDHRLPDFEDRPHLPYIECILRELYRYDVSNDCNYIRSAQR